MRLRPLRFPPLAVGLAALAAGTSAGAQERLQLETFGDEALHRLGLEAHGDGTKPLVEGDVHGGAESALFRGTGPTPEWPLAVTAGFGLGVRHEAGELVQIRSEASIPLPVAIGASAGPMRIWDVDGAHRLRAGAGLGGTLGDKLARWRGGADVEVEGALFQGGKYGTSFVRQDIGPYPFFDARGRLTVMPRLAVDTDTALVLPVSAELRRVELERPDGVYGFTSERVASGFGVKSYGPKFSHGWLELVGVGWEQASFTGPSGAPRPKLGRVDKLDLRFLHLDGFVAFSPLAGAEMDWTTELSGNWLHDATSRAKLSAVTGSLSAAIRGFPNIRKNKARHELAGGIGVVRDGVYLADGSALSRRNRFEAYFESSFMDRRAGASIQGAAEQLEDVGGDHHPYRGALALEWFLSPMRPLELGVHHTSTEQCVSSATAAGPAWCHRFGLFLRASGRWAKPESKCCIKPTPEDARGMIGAAHRAAVESLVRPLAAAYD
jgi:hypothetical protein